MEGKLDFIDLDVTILNLYAHYKNRECFGGSLSNSGLLNVENLVIVGDLNFTTSPTEILGHSAKVHLLADCFKSLMEIFDLVDIIPPIMKPTWRNGRSGKELYQRD